MSYNVLQICEDHKKKSQFRTNLQRIIDRGFSKDVALAAITTYPAEAMGVDKILGKIRYMSMNYADNDPKTKPDYKIVELDGAKMGRIAINATIN